MEKIEAIRKGYAIALRNQHAHDDHDKAREQVKIILKEADELFAEVLGFRKGNPRSQYHDTATSDHIMVPAAIEHDASASGTTSQESKKGHISNASPVTWRRRAPAKVFTGGSAGIQSQNFKDAAASAQTQNLSLANPVTKAEDSNDRRVVLNQTPVVGTSHSPIVKVEDTDMDGIPHEPLTPILGEPQIIEAEDREDGAGSGSQRRVGHLRPCF